MLDPWERYCVSTSGHAPVAATSGLDACAAFGADPDHLPCPRRAVRHADGFFIFVTLMTLAAVGELCRRFVLGALVR